MPGWLVGQRGDAKEHQNGKTGIFKNKYGARNTGTPAFERVILFGFIEKPSCKFKTIVNVLMQCHNNLLF